MDLIENNDITNKIKEFAIKNSKEEICGLILDNKIVMACKNDAGDKKHFFSICPQDYLKASILRSKIICSYHSQPNENSEFSEFDKQNSKNHKLPMLMYHLATNTFKYFDPNLIENPNKYSKYINIPFELGKNDCFTLIQNYYKNELNIDIIVNKEIKERKIGWIKDNLLEKGFLLNSKLVKLSKHPKINDIIVFNYLKKGNPHHLGIFLGSEFLHHPRNKLSRIDLFDENYNKKVDYFVRYDK